MRMWWIFLGNPHHILTQIMYTIYLHICLFILLLSGKFYLAAASLTLKIKYNETRMSLRYAAHFSTVRAAQRSLWNRLNPQRSSSRSYRYATIIKAKHHIVKHIQTECYLVYTTVVWTYKEPLHAESGLLCWNIEPYIKKVLCTFNKWTKTNISEKCAAVFCDKMFRFFAAILVGSLVMVGDCSRGWVPFPHSFRA